MQPDPTTVAAATEGRFDKFELEHLLPSELRPSFRDACARIEVRFTQECAATGDPCLDSGCSVVGDDHQACLQPLLRSDADYRKACGAEWVRMVEGR